MGLDYIDLYYIHNPAPDPEKMPAAETARALMDLKKEGKIRAIGLSNVQPHHIEEYVGLGCQVDIIQRKYSMLERSVEAEILPLCRKYGLSFHAYSPLERGLLCDIAMDGDRGILSQNPHLEFHLGDTIGKGCATCQVTVSKTGK